MAIALHLYARKVDGTAGDLVTTTGAYSDHVCGVVTNARIQNSATGKILVKLERKLTRFRSLMSLVSLYRLSNHTGDLHSWYLSKFSDICVRRSAYNAFVLA